MRTKANARDDDDDDEELPACLGSVQGKGEGEREGVDQLVRRHRDTQPKSALCVDKVT